MIEKYIRRKLFMWHKDNYRDFPWRLTKDPYKIMIAEFMLHRTKAEQVRPVYERFIKTYPNVYSLSCARIGEIKEFTMHLGLHWRTSHFIKAAKFVVKNYKGDFPATADKLFKIPGVGKYVAGAILSIYFLKKYPVIDANIARFINMFYGLKLEGEIRRKREVINIAAQLFDTGNPGKFLFAIIDFTALICKSRLPAHQLCVLHNHCHYYQEIHEGRSNG
jgi:A/G-specific adenine glycosylase